jgi:hypothetical protein
MFFPSLTHQIKRRKNERRENQEMNNLLLWTSDSLNYQHDETKEEGNNKGKNRATCDAISKR